MKKTKLVLLMEEFAIWWNSVEDPSVPNFVKHKLLNGELNDVQKATDDINKLADALGFTVDGES